MSPPRKAKAAMSSRQFQQIVERSGLKQGQVAKKLGVSLRTVTRWLSGHTPIDSPNALYIKAVFEAN